VSLIITTTTTTTTTLPTGMAGHYVDSRELILPLQQRELL
jgi:hypothetical protein